MKTETTSMNLPLNGTGKGEAHPKQWLAAYVRLFHEKKTGTRLSKLGIENFLPIQEEVHQWSDRRKKIERVLIPMVIFVRVSKDEQTQVLNLPSVSRYMASVDKKAPLVIPDEQMERFKFMLDYSEKAVSISNDSLQSGERIRVIKGPLTGLVGELVMMNDTPKVAVRLDMLGFASVEMPIGYIEPIV